MLIGWLPQFITSKKIRHSPFKMLGSQQTGKQDRFEFSYDTVNAYCEK